MVRTHCLRSLATLFLVTAAATAARGEGFHWKDDPAAGVCDLFDGEQPVLRYVYTVDTSTPEKTADTTKVFHHVYGPGTTTQITKGPGGKFPHHRGLYVGWNKTSFEGMTQDFWHLHKGESQRHVDFLDLTGDAEHGAMTSHIDWNAIDGKPAIVETRTVSVRKLPIEGQAVPAWQIDWSTTLKSQRGEITLDGDRQHAGFQFRAAGYVADKNNARYVRPEGFPEQPAAFEVSDSKDPNGHINLGWLAMTYDIEGAPFTVEYFEDPALPKPSRYSERPYGRFGAFFKTTLTEEKPLTMRYRLIVTAAPPQSREAIAGRYAEFVAGIKK